MNFKTRLEGKEGKWIRVHFMDTSFFTGILKHVGIDFIEVECYEKSQIQVFNPMKIRTDFDKLDKQQEVDQSMCESHLIPLGLIKFITVEANGFIDAERKRLEYIASKTINIQCSTENDSDGEIIRNKTNQNHQVNNETEWR